MQKMGAMAYQRRCLCRGTAKICAPEAPEPRIRALPDSELFPEIIGAIAVDEWTETRTRRDRVEWGRNVYVFGLAYTEVASAEPKLDPKPKLAYSTSELIEGNFLQCTRSFHLDQ